MRDANFVASTSAALTETVLYPTTVSIASDASSALIGSKVTLSASVGSSYGAPTGNVIFLDGSSVLGQAALTGGAATFSSSTLSRGSHSIQASYQGDSTFVTGNSSVMNQTITDFSIAATNSSLTLNAGGSGTYRSRCHPYLDSPDRLDSRVRGPRSWRLVAFRRRAYKSTPAP